MQTSPPSVYTQINSLGVEPLKWVEVQRIGAGQHDGLDALRAPLRADGHQVGAVGGSAPDDLVETENEVDNLTSTTAISSSARRAGVSPYRTPCGLRQRSVRYLMFRRKEWL
jgi:hypothetical protein